MAGASDGPPLAAEEMAGVRDDAAMAAKEMTGASDGAPMAAEEVFGVRDDAAIRNTSLLFLILITNHN